MNNVTINDNKVKRIYINNLLATDIKYNNKQILGYQSTRYEMVDCYNRLLVDRGSVSNNSIYCSQNGIINAKTKYFSNGCEFRINIVGYISSLSIRIKNKELFKINYNYVDILGDRIYIGSNSEINFNVIRTNRFTATITGNINGVSFNSKTINLEDSSYYNGGEIQINTGSNGNVNINGGFIVCSQYDLQE
jgi:hypothetical protein